MRSPRFPASSRDRLRWAIGESLVIAGVFLFWLGVALVLMLVLNLLALLTVTLGLERWVDPFMRAVYEVDFLWSAVTSLSVISATLYVIVRAGTVLVDRYLGARA